MKFRRPGIIDLLALSLVSGLGDAQTINWYNSPGRINLTSSGQPMDGTFQFQLGTFSSGFIPSIGNMSQWMSNWVPLDSTSYSGGANSFDATSVISTNTPPFVTGGSAYIWGRSISSGGSQWILFRRSTWTWPNASSFPPGFQDWDTAAADQVIFGSIIASGSPHLMKSAAVASYSQWVSSELSGEPQSAANDDPDNDGILNLLEFVFGKSPLVPNPPAVTPLSLVNVSGQNYLQFSVPRIAGRLAAFTVEVSSDMITWTSGAGNTVVTEDSTAALVVRDLTPFDQGSPRRFMRLKVALP